jgi:integrase/recombinase XerC
VTLEEAALLRHLARQGRDSLLDEVTITLPERLGLRRIELCRLRICDVDLQRRTLEVWGKGDKDRTMPIPPQLCDLLAVYVEDRRPSHLAASEWWRSSETLLRRPPSPASPLGVAAGRRRIEDLFDRFRRNAPDLFSRGDLSLHSYRHALATFIDGRYGRPVTRAVLGHTSRRTPTDHYVHVPAEHVAQVLAGYEREVAGPQQSTTRILDAVV